MWIIKIDCKIKILGLCWSYLSPPNATKHIPTAQQTVAPSSPISSFEHGQWMWYWGCDTFKHLQPSQCLGILYLIYINGFKSTAKCLFSSPPLLCSIISTIHGKIRQIITHLWSWRASGTLLNIRVIDTFVWQQSKTIKTFLSVF